MPRTFFSKTMPHSACKSTFSDLRYLTFTRFFDGTPRVRAPTASRFLSQLFALFHLLPSRRQYLSSFVCESTHKIATFREDLVTADDNGTNIRGNWTNYCLPAGTNLATPKTNEIKPFRPLSVPPENSCTCTRPTWYLAPAGHSRGGKAKHRRERRRSHRESVSG